MAEPTPVLYGLEKVQIFGAFHDKNATGELRAFGYGQALPPEMPGIRNVYDLYNVTGVRGNHAHRFVHKVLRVISGCVRLELDGRGERAFQPRVWRGGLHP